MEYSFSTCGKFQNWRGVPFLYRFLGKIQELKPSALVACFTILLVLFACRSEQDSSSPPAQVQPESSADTAVQAIEAVPEQTPATLVRDEELDILRQFASYVGETEPDPAWLETLIDQASSRIGENSPVWPVSLFVQAESFLKIGKLSESRRLFSQLARWGGSNVYGDDWGGSGLAVFGLWRWVQAVDGDLEIDRSELEEILQLDRFLRRDAKLTTGIFQFSFLDSLPQIEEDLVRRLSLLAFRAGLEEKAQALFIDYLAISTQDLGEEENLLFEEIITRNWASRDRLLTRKALRLEELRRYGDAAEIWRSLLDAKDAHDRAFAGLRLALYERDRFVAKPARISDRLDTVLRDAKDPILIQEVLYTRARTWEGTGSEAGLSRFCADMTTLLERYPKGEWADEARFRLAHFAGRQYLAGASHACGVEKLPFDESMEHYRLLQEFSGENDREDSAYFHPALLYYSRGEEGDFSRAVSLLEKLNRVRPSGPYFRNAAFWKARILEEMDELSDAQSAFEEVVAENPLDYFGLRARMHLADGPAAAQQLWPGPELRQEITRHYKNNPSSEILESDNPYALRLSAVVETGLYVAVVNHRGELKKSLPGKRLQTIPLDTIDAVPGAISTLGLFLSFRQDAIAAADMETLAANHLSIQSLVGNRAEDWPLALAMANGEAHLHYGMSNIGSHPRYLSTVYPATMIGLFRSASQQWVVPPELLYSLARRESLFDPLAISVADALGLFQFIEDTFDDLDRNWKLLEESGAQNREEYLIDAELNVNLGARWLAEEILDRQNCFLLEELGKECSSANMSNDDLVLVPRTEWFRDGLSTRQQRVLMLSLMEHSKGFKRVKSWLNRWRNQGRAEDFEYMLTTADSVEARILTRNVITDATIAVSIGLFDETDQ